MTTILPDPVSMFPEWEQDRVRLTGQRYLLAMEDVDDLLRRYMEEQVGVSRLGKWAPPNTAFNALSSICHALSTPGHYSTAPMILGDASEALTAALAGVWPAAQWREYLTYALGAAASLVEPDGENVAVHVVPPHHLWADSRPGRPSEIQTIRRLVVREVGGRQAYTWDVWDLPTETFKVRIAEAGGKMGADITASVFPDLDGYPWRDSSGRAYLPWSVDRSWDVGDLWNWQRGRSVARGTLHVMMLWSACDRCALNATGKVTLVFGGTPLGVETRQGAYNGTSSFTLDVDPGDIIFVQPIPEYAGGMSATEIGEVETLPALLDYTKAAASQLATDLGITPTDAVRASANPMSGAAIQLTNATRRQEQRRRNPLARAHDLSMLSHVCAVLGLSTSGLGVSYHEIPLSPEEEREERDRLEWQRSQGLASTVDLMIAVHPGMSREQAIAEIRRVRAEEAAILAEAGASEAPLVGVLTTAADVIAKVAAGEMPRESGVAWLVEYGGLAPESADRMMGTAGAGFVSTTSGGAG